MKPRTAIVFYMGFSEKDNGGLNGTTRLSIAAHKEFHGPDVDVYYARTWKANIQPQIAQIKNLGVTRVIIVGYSWGFGRAALTAARIAKDYHLEVPLMVSIDGVYRAPLPAWMGANPLLLGSLFPNKAIVIPPNVMHVHGVYQTLDVPRGHICERELLTTRPIIHPFLHLPYAHSVIDDSPECHEHVLSQVRKTL